MRVDGYHNQRRWAEGVSTWRLRRARRKLGARRDRNQLDGYGLRRLKAVEDELAARAKLW